MNRGLGWQMVDRLFADAGLAALYDRLCPRGQRADFDFYLPLVMSAKAVLDIGCGTGAMLQEARDAGHVGRLCGLDPAAGMLTQARKRADIEWILGDLASTDWDGEFDLVVMTGHAFQVLIEDDELRRSLAAIRSALTYDGRFVFETRNRLARAWDDWTPENSVEFADTDGVKVRMNRNVTATVDDRLVSFTHTFTSPKWNQPQVSTSTLRFFDAASLLPFLVDAGLVIEEQFGDWDRTPVSATSPEIITIARKDATRPRPHTTKRRNGRERKQPPASKMRRTQFLAASQLLATERRGGSAWSYSDANWLDAHNDNGQDNES